MGTTAPRARLGFVRGPGFDQALLVGAPVLALGLAVTCLVSPDLWPVVLLADIWLLGYHHVVATFTRTLMDRESFREHGVLSLVLLPLVGLSVWGVAAVAGVWAINTIYLYWQWWHYTRQSYGVERIYARSGGVHTRPSRLTWHLIYSFPAWAMLERCAMGWGTGDTFLGSEVLWLPVPYWAAHLVGLVVGGVLVAWIIEQVQAWRAGELAVGRTLYVLGHLTVFGVGYAVIPDADYGWLAVNIWHNLQYLFVVWLFNSNRFRGGVSDDAKVLSWLSQPRHAVFYVGFLLLLTTALYGGITTGLVAMDAGSLGVAVILFQTLNFHHYIVDSRIWKLRKKRVSGTFATAPKG